MFLSILLIWIIFFISIIFISKDLVIMFPPSMKLENLGIFGDSFNVLTSLFTGLAFAGVIISVILQTQELKEARIEMSGQKKALENQEFDNKFFQMLNQFNNIINNIKYLSAKDKVALNELRLRFERELTGKSTALKDLIKPKEIKNLQEFQKLFTILNNELDTSFKYYFINLYQIIKYIDTSSNSKEEAKEYTNILRAQLSKNELVLLFYNAIGVIEFSGNNYKEFVEKYNFFEHLRYQDLNPNGKVKIVDLLILRYTKDAFGKNIKLQEKWDLLKEER